MKNTRGGQEHGQQGSKRETLQRRKTERDTEYALEEAGWKSKQNLLYAYARSTGKIESWAGKVMASAIEEALRPFDQKEVVQKTRLGRRTYYSPDVVSMIFDILDTSPHNPKNKR